MNPRHRTSSGRLSRFRCRGRARRSISIGDAVVDSHETSDPRRRGTGRGRMGRRPGSGASRVDRHGRSPARLVSADDSSFNEELIEDRYAALQAWSEWTESQRTSGQPDVRDRESPRLRRPAEPSPEPDTPPLRNRRGSLEPSPATAPPGIRAEAQHEFAPYSQLFTRLRQSKQP